MASTMSATGSAGESWDTGLALHRDSTALLALADGTVFHGHAIGAWGQAVGEVVFNTAMTGYQEILTDPSYYRQLVALTYPHIGNVGVNAEDEESPRIHAAGLIVRDVPRLYSNWRAREGLSAYLARQGVVGIAGIDTRKLTRILREKGAQMGCILAGKGLDAAHAVELARTAPGLQGMDLAREVSTSQVYTWAEPGWDAKTLSQPGPREDLKYHVVAYDYGVKRNILRQLVDRGCRITVVPAQTPAQEVLAMRPDGVLLSNGPGDPAACDYAIQATRELLDAEIPLFGICLGHQLLALACQARTVKMKFGHHGANHPVQELATGRVMISSQNHGFAVDEASLPPNVVPTHKSLFDGSLQGIRLIDKPAYGFQGHPEASPGPHDVAPVFEPFIEDMRQRRHR